MEHPELVMKFLTAVLLGAPLNPRAFPDSGSALDAFFCEQGL